MGNISSKAELHYAIQLLEAEQAVKLELMKKQFHLAYESLKPINLIDNVLNEIIASPYQLNNLLSSGVGLAADYLSKKAFKNTSNNKFRKFLRIAMQFGITNIIAQNPKILKSLGKYISGMTKR